MESHGRCSMPQQISLFLNLPRELRDKIYQYVFEDWPEIPYKVKGSRIVLYATQGERTYRERPTAFLKPANLTAETDHRLVCTAAFPRVNRHIRSEFSDFLRSYEVDTVARVRNFDFGHVIEHISGLSPNKLEAYHVRVDGTSTCILELELGGPYDFQWRVNLNRWIEYVEGWVGLEGELMTAHKTIPDLSTQDSFTRAPPEIVRELYACTETHALGAGRLELSKIFYTLLARCGLESFILVGDRAKTLSWLVGWTPF